MSQSSLFDNKREPSPLFEWRKSNDSEDQEGEYQRRYKRPRTARTKQKTRSLERSSSGSNLSAVETESSESPLRKMGNSSTSRIRLPFKAKRKSTMDFDSFVPIV